MRTHRRDDADELDADFEREWAALMGDTQGRMGGLALGPGPAAGVGTAQVSRCQRGGVAQGLRVPRGVCSAVLHVVEH